MRVVIDSCQRLSSMNSMRSIWTHKCQNECATHIQSTRFTSLQWKIRCFVLFLGILLKSNRKLRLVKNFDSFEKWSLFGSASWNDTAMLTWESLLYMVRFHYLNIHSFAKEIIENFKCSEMDIYRFGPVSRVASVHLSVRRTISRKKNHIFE